MNNPFPKFDPEKPKRSAMRNLPERKPLPTTPRSGKISGFPTPPIPAKPLPKASQPPQRAFPVANRETFKPSTAVTPETASNVVQEEVDEETEEEPIVVQLTEDQLREVEHFRDANFVDEIEEERIYRIATSSDPVVRKMLAMNEDTPPNILALLANDPDEQVREEVVFNSATPKEAYEAMVNDKSTWVIEALITNTRTSSSMLKILSKTDDPYLMELLTERGY